MNDVDLILASGLFDPAAYRREIERDGEPAALAEHYLEEGERSRLSPSADFDPAFYAAANPDVAGTQERLLVHYIAFGRREGRYATRAAVHRDGAKVRASHLYRPEYFEGFERFARLPGLSDVEAYLLESHRLPAIADVFDGAFYREQYADGADRGGPAVIHYLDVGCAESRVPTLGALQQRMAAAGPCFDERHYLAQFPDDARPAEPLRHFVLYGEALGYEPERAFSPEYYRRRNRATVEHGASPYLHFVLHGRAEGRPGRLDVSARRRRGNVAFQPGKPGLAIVTPDMRPGEIADLALLLAERLSTSRNVVVVSRAGGSLEAAFAERCTDTFAGPFDEIDAEYLLRETASSHRVEAVLVNSARCWEFGSAALCAGLPSVALVHEFAEYVVPAGRATTLVEFADRVVVPSQRAADSVAREVVEARGFAPRHAAVRPQCRVPAVASSHAERLTPVDLRELLRCSDRDVPIVVGAGPIDLRAGIDLFLETAAMVRDRLDGEIRFAWLSSEYRPKSDITTSVWIADMIEKFDLREHLFILDRTDDLALFLEHARVVYAPARMDGFPRVVTEAISRGKRVVCFEGSGAAAETLERFPSLGHVVGYADTSHAAAVLVEACTAAKNGAALGEASDEERTAFASTCDVDDYVALVERSLADAARDRATLEDATRKVTDRGEFDGAFHDGDPMSAGGLAARRAALAFAARTAKGLAAQNPHPGFDAGAYLARARSENGVAYGSLLDEARGASTHRCIELDALAPRGAPAGVRIALHLHFHYPELAPEFFERLRSLAMPIDLFISTTRKGRVPVERAFGEYEFGTVAVVDVPNVGRDIGPLIVDFARPLLRGRYDLIGHLHGKRSLSAPPGMGDRWRAYLLHALLGDRDTLAKITGLFEGDPALGLVFAEDRYSVPWGKNLAFAQKLAAEITPPPALPAWPIFPKGTMFWCRPEVLLPLWNRGFAYADLSAEPLPDDGSLLHAIERMLPSLAEASGLTWATLVRDGSTW